MPMLSPSATVCCVFLITSFTLFISIQRDLQSVLQLHDCMDHLQAFANDM